MQLKGYTLKNQIKSGYKINTYTGIRDEDQRPVVIKLLPFDYPNASDQSIILHEYNILKSLKFAEASQVIELIAAHNEVGPVLVLDKIEGISLSTYIKKNKITLLKFFTISLNIINVVSLIHKQNIIHKDIKPANIMINPQTLAISIIDFSIATELSAENEKFENAYILEGSLPYISPEQTGRMNQSIDYRTDYYSLGITFFEILTGSLPFKADDTLDWIHCHIAKKPPLITNINPNLPKMLAAIIEKLMAKIPDDRYASLNGLKVDIKKCETQLKQKGYIEDFTLGQNDISEHLHLNHRLIGRENETLSLLSAFERVANGASEIVFVKGYSGIGKTALVKELHKPITFKKGHFTSGKYDQLKKSKPYLGFIDAFQELTRQLLTEPEEKLNRIRNKLNENLGVNGQILINLIPNIEHIIGPQPDAPVIPISKNKSRFLKVFKNFISAVSDAESPLVIFLDDLQWIDIASLQLLESLTLENFATHILIIGSYRDNEIDENHPLHDLKIKLIYAL